MCARPSESTGLIDVTCQAGAEEMPTDFRLPDEYNRGLLDCRKRDPSDLGEKGLIKTPFWEGRRVWVAGHGGMVGRALARRLRREDAEIIVLPRDQADLRRQNDTEDWLAEARPDTVFLAAAKVGGIHANNAYPADFLYDNLQIEANIIEAARRTGVRKLVFLGSSCIYPKHADQPIREDSLLTGPLEPTNQWYAIAKIAGLMLCQAYRRQYGCDFIAAMPTNLYGPGDNFDLQNSHVMAALIRKVAEAKEAKCDTVEVWGTGNVRREFLHVDDCADALVFLAEVYADEAPINVGTGQDLTIRELVELIADIAEYSGRPVFDTSKPDGTPRKQLNVTRLTQLGWLPTISLREGIAQTLGWFRGNHGKKSPQTVSSGLT